MKNWEDIVKDKLEGYESGLPEGSLAEFRALRNGAGSALPKKRHPLLWGTLVVAAAACIAAILFLRHPSPQEDMIQIVEHPVVAEAESSDAPADVMVAQTVTPRPTVSASQIVSAEPDEQPDAGLIKPTDENPDQTESQTIQRPDNQLDGQTIQRPDNQTAAIGPEPVLEDEDSYSPFIPDSPKQEVKKIDVGAAAGCVAGGGLIAAVIPELAALKGKPDAKDQAAPIGAPGHYGGISSPILNPSKVSYDHIMPLRFGLSAGIPVAENLKVTTGLEYSLYSSNVKYASGPRKKQHAHYIGIPVRLDWIFASKKKFDVYVGGGIEGDVCIGATQEGRSLKKDGPSLSLLAAGGVQFNFSRRLGIYLEPQLNWTVCSDDRTLETYRSVRNPSFTVATGLRFNLGD